MIGGQKPDFTKWTDADLSKLKFIDLDEEDEDALIDEYERRRSWDAKKRATYNAQLIVNVERDAELLRLGYSLEYIQRTEDATPTAVEE